jgi:hypothetical protein
MAVLAPTYNGGLVNTTFTTNNSSFTTTNVTPSAYFSSANLNPLMDLNELDELSVKSASNSKSIETGRVEKGSNSDQKIKLMFSTYHFTPSNIKCYLYLKNKHY